MRTVLIASLLLLSGCPSVMQNLPGGRTARQGQEADRLMEQGDYAAARSAYRKIAGEKPGTSTGEQAAFQAARILVEGKNPSKDYRQADREFEAYLHDYPSGRHAGEAASWLALLENAEQSRVNALVGQVDELTKKLDQATGETRKTGEERDAAAKERDALAGERDELRKRIGVLLQEKENLITERSALLRERDGLARDKVSLEKKVETLTRDKERLAAAKAKLEQRLRKVTDIDIKMEKKRKKMQ